MNVQELLCKGIAIIGGMHCGREHPYRVWGYCKSRKLGSCCLTGKPYRIGDIVYRPISNGNDRMLRALASEVERHDQILTC